MGMVRLVDYCCHGGDKVIDQRQFDIADLVLAQEGNRELIFSPLGNRPRSPKLALVGITPGAQSEKFVKLLCHYDVEIAAAKSAFAGAHEIIRNLLSAHGFLQALRIHCTPDLNASDNIFTTSLVKCCLKVDGGYKYTAPDISASRAASYCLSKRFVPDIERLDSIRHVVIFGKPGWDAVNSVPRRIR